MASAMLSVAGPSNSSSTTTTDINMQDRAFKRKFEDAMQHLDEAVGPHALPDSAPSPKKPKLSRSLYSTLAKYGIKKEPKPQGSNSHLESLSKTAPHFVSLLSRSASRVRKPMPFKPSSPAPSAFAASSAAEYRPSSTTSFLARLATYKLTTYANKPTAIDAVAAAKCGWTNEGKDRLACGICGVSWVVANKDGMSREAAAALVEKQRLALTGQHKDGCPWKSKQCDDSIYRVPLQTPAAMARELKARAARLDPIMQDVQIKHPMTSAQVQALLSVLHSFKLRDDATPQSSEASSQEESISAIQAPSTAVVDPSETATLTALFGWTVASPSTSSTTAGPSSVSRANSVTPSRSTTPIPVRSRVSFGLPSISRSSSPAPSPRPPLPGGGESSQSISAFTPSGKMKADSTLLFCPLCQRRVGLWAFLPTSTASGTPPPPLPSGPSLAGETSGGQPRRQLDILKEHRSYCPYVVRSTVVPSLPVASGIQGTAAGIASAPYAMGSNPSLSQLNGQPTPVEGWRAVMSMVLRHGATQRQRLGRSASLRRTETTSTESNEAPESVDELTQVDAMVQGVKSRGGRDLLKYVKGLLG